MNHITLSESIYTLTDYGARTAAGVVDRKSSWPQGFNDAGKAFLKQMQRDKYVNVGKMSPHAIESLFEKGIIQTEIVDENDSAALKHKLTRRYLTSPVRLVDVVMLEYTTQCNLNCRSCFKGGLPKITENHTDDLLDAIEDLKQMGVGRFLFNGGEVTSCEEDWLDIVRKIASTGHVVSVITNGWWGMMQPFSALGHRFKDAFEFATTIKKTGVSEMMLSLDGPRKMHDAYRRCSGLYDRVLQACRAAKSAGIRCGVSIVLHDGLEHDDAFFQDVMRIFELPADPRSMPKKGKKTIQTGVLMEREYDAGNACKSIAERCNAPYDIDRLEMFQGLCKGVTRGMRLCIRANGEVEPCTVGTMGKGYGNIHNERLPFIINRMRLSPVYQMFEHENFENYLPYYSRHLFGTRFFHPCTFFGIISSLADGIENLREKGELTLANINNLNQKIAKEIGFV